MYAIRIKNDSTNEGVIVICPSAISVKEWIYKELLRVMRNDIATNVTLATMREIVSFYNTQFVNLDDLDADPMSLGFVETYHGVKYDIEYYVEPLKTVNVI